MLDRLSLTFALFVPALSAQAATPEEVQGLFDAMGLPELVEVMRQEGLAYGEDIARDMLGGASAPDWQARVGAIYDTDLMERSLLTGLQSELAEAEIGPVVAFFESETGQEIIGLELAARRAMLDDAVEEAAREAAAIAMADETDRHALIEAYAEANDLIETNVVGALNANLAFYQGLAMGGALPADLTEDQILRDVWAQEPEIRVSTTEWVYGFLTLAYEPLEDAELTAYTEFSLTPEGRVLNRALFAAFDGLFNDISRALGLEVAQELSSARL